MPFFFHTQRLGKGAAYALGQAVASFGDFSDLFLETSHIAPPHNTQICFCRIMYVCLAWYVVAGLGGSALKHYRLYYATGLSLGAWQVKFFLKL